MKCGCAEKERAEGAAEAASLELAMRSILRMFAEGNLVYRSRGATVNFDVEQRARRVREWRRRQWAKT